jgi:hypothetical protein
VGCDNDVKVVVAVAAAAQCGRTSNCHGGRTARDQVAVVLSGRSE